jgi:hypothetical protein
MESNMTLPLFAQDDAGWDTDWDEFIARILVLYQPQAPDYEEGYLDALVKWFEANGR